MTMKPPPPIPDENGSVTPRTAAAVTAASTACFAGVPTVAAAPPVPVAVAGPCGPGSAKAATCEARTTNAATNVTAIERTSKRRIDSLLDVGAYVLLARVVEEYGRPSPGGKPGVSGPALSWVTGASRR